VNTRDTKNEEIFSMIHLSGTESSGLTGECSRTSDRTKNEVVFELSHRCVLFLKGDDFSSKQFFPLTWFEQFKKRRGAEYGTPINERR